MLYFKCQDQDCEKGDRIPQSLIMARVNPEGRIIRKCPHCRGRTKIIEPPWSHNPEQDYLTIEECKDGYLYFIRARNSFIGIYCEDNKSFFISRLKFGSNFIDTEYHWDIGAPYGTVNPLLELEEAPIFENDAEKLEWLNNQRELYKPVNGD